MHGVRKIRPTRTSRHACLARLALAAVIVWGASWQAVAQPQRDEELCRLYVINRDGTGLRLLAEAVLPGMRWNGSPEWSHDGTRIAFDATPKDGEFNKSRITVYHVAGPRMETIEDLGDGNVPTWSPDDSQIAFMLNGGTPCGDRSGLWVMNADGTGRERLATGWRPYWSPDGRYLAFQDSFSHVHSNRLFDTERGNVQSIEGTAIDKIAWSPNGKQVAIISIHTGQPEIQIVNVTISARTRRRVWPRGEGFDTGGMSNPNVVIWSPKRDELLVRFQAAENRTGFYLLSLGTNEPPRLLEAAGPHGFVINPAWSPDGSQVVFASNRASPSSTRTEHE